MSLLQWSAGGVWVLFPARIEPTADVFPVGAWLLPQFSGSAHMQANWCECGWLASVWMQVMKVMKVMLSRPRPAASGGVRWMMRSLLSLLPSAALGPVVFLLLVEPLGASEANSFALLPSEEEEGNLRMFGERSSDPRPPC